MSAREECDLLEGAAEDVIEAAREYVQAVGFNPAWMSEPHRRFFGRLVDALVALDEPVVEAPQWIGPRSPFEGKLHLVRGERTACDLPLQPHWHLLSVGERPVCRDCAAIAGESAKKVTMR